MKCRGLSENHVDEMRSEFVASLLFELSYNACMHATCLHDNHAYCGGAQLDPCMACTTGDVRFGGQTSMDQMQLMFPWIDLSMDGWM